MNKIESALVLLLTLALAWAALYTLPCRDNEDRTALGNYGASCLYLDPVSDETFTLPKWK